jgi:hypothetical protein
MKKNKLMKNLWLKIIIWGILIIFIIMILIYSFSYYNEPTNNKFDWIRFGTFFGSISGLLAFAGVLYSVKQSKEASTEESERATFFNLLELHNNIFKSINYNGKTDIEAFKELNSIANANLNYYLGLYMTKKICGDKDASDVDNIYDNYKKDKEGSLFKMLEATYKTYSVGDFYKPANLLDKSNTSGFRNLIVYANKGMEKLIYKKVTEVKDIQAPIFNFKDYTNYINEKVLYEGILTVADLMYKNYGHIYGRYFRNMYYVMDTINNFTDNKNYKELFRAQLSRYELSFGLFNALSSNSSRNMVDLLRGYDIFKDIFYEDLSIFKDNPDTSSTVNNLLMEYLNKYQNNCYSSEKCYKIWSYLINKLGFKDSVHNFV